MTDLFISYASEDLERVRPLVTAFEEQGWSVWWDRELVAGPSYEDKIEAALDEARCVVVVWSRLSIKSQWVRTEAHEGLEREILVPLLIDDVKPPLAYRISQTAKMIDWPRQTGQLESVIDGIAELVGPGENRIGNSLQDSKSATGGTIVSDTGPSLVAGTTTSAIEPSLDQKIRYCRTADGVRIAYAESGEGAPIVRSMGWFTHLGTEWDSPLGRSFWQRMSRQHRLIRYDGRGIGLSEATIEFSAETRLNDLEAAVDAAKLDKFTLFGLSEGSRTALRYAFKHPDRVTHLILYGSAVRDTTKKDAEGDAKRAKTTETFGSMIELGWGKVSYRKFFTDLFVGQKASQEMIDYFLEVQRSSASQETATAYFRSLTEHDESFNLANQIHIPTLILHAEDDQIVPFQNSLDLAAEIPGAQLKPMVGDCHFLVFKSDQSEEYINIIEMFIGSGQTEATH